MPKMLPSLHLILTPLLLVLTSTALPSASAGKSGDGYFHGRATFYDDNTEGACRYGTNIPEFYAAWPDSQEGYQGSCGTCYEVQCVNEGFHDGYGAHVDRAGACYDESKRVVVKIVDSCPCVHQNYYSNQRWCCGDMNHIDLGRRAYKELADEHWGVIGLKWRQVSCDQLGVVSGGSSSSTSSNDNNSNDDSNDGNDSGNSRQQQQGSWQQGSSGGQWGDFGSMWGNAVRTFSDKGWN